MQPFQTKIKDGRSVHLGVETCTERQHLGCVTVVQGNHVLQINEAGLQESRGPLLANSGSTIVCLTFDTEDGRRFYRTYEYQADSVVVTTSQPVPVADWEDDPQLGITPSRLRRA